VFYRLERSNYERVRPLFQGLDYQLITQAVLAGASPGKIWVDDARRPKSAFMISPEGCFLAGYEGNEGFNRALNELIMGTLLAKAGAIVVECHPDTWEQQLGVVLAGRPATKRPRRHYLFDHGQVDWRAKLPDGFAIERIDTDLLSRPGLIVPAHVTAWMENNWASVDGFMRNGFGFCTVHGKRLVSWCLADCVVGDACEIGIHTDPAHRRRGLATLTVAATVDHCLSHGLAAIGWHCDEDNYGSRGVAEKVGFVKERDVVDYLCLADDEPANRSGA
jgi:RimJ/RimL family protein N-acetyltransferase